MKKKEEIMSYEKILISLAMLIIIVIVTGALWEGLQRNGTKCKERGFDGYALEEGCYEKICTQSRGLENCTNKYYDFDKFIEIEGVKK